MKRVLAILALANLILLLPLAAMAVDRVVDAECTSLADAEGIALDGVPDQQDADGLIQQGTMGDPDELGGGFRNLVLPPSTNGEEPFGPVPVIDSMFLLLIQLI